MPKNKITTPGYFAKRLRDAGYYVVKVFDKYNDTDRRKWTVLVNPRKESLYITCCDNGDWPYRGLYEFDDGGKSIPNNFYVNTESVEVVLKNLIEFGIISSEQTLNNNNERRPGTKKETSAKETSS